MTFDPEAVAAAQLAKPIRSRQRSRNWRSDDDYWRRKHAEETAEGRAPEEPALTAQADWEDAHDERLYDEPGDILLDRDELPPGYDRRWGGF